MNSKFGLNRVLEPKGVFPPVAWKLDIDRKLRPGEARIKLDIIHVEWGSFQQICNSCGYSYEKISERIMDIVEKRGKLQNPATKSGGLMMGTVEEISEDFNSHFPISVGQKICCMSSISCLPTHIDEILDIDYDYGQIICRGYAIIFESTLFCDPNISENLRPNAIMAALDASGSLLGSAKAAMEQGAKTVAILGNNIHTMLLYAGAMREVIGPDCKLVGLLDDYYNDNISRDDFIRLLSPLFNYVEFVDFSEPVKSYFRLEDKIDSNLSIDMGIVTDSLSGVETLAVELVKNQGSLYFTSFHNNYNIAAICAESIGKTVISYAFDQFMDGFLEFVKSILRDLESTLSEIDQVYQSYSGSWRTTKNRAKSFAVDNAGQEDGFIYSDIVTKLMVKDIINIAKFDCNVIIQGETGVGKEKVLELIHQNSSRYSKPCVKINCATISESLAESEFFGYEKGAFTGATSEGKIGYFQAANEGILFLDEIGALSLNMQSKLLRVIQENQFIPVGSTKPVNVNVRVICANNIPLRNLVDQGTFREDLYYRLNIYTIEVPPLRDRPSDILALIKYFLEKYNKKYNMSKEFTPSALSVFHEYSWPGNVRELENVIHRLVISCKEDIIDSPRVQALIKYKSYSNPMDSIVNYDSESPSISFHEVMEAQEKQLIEFALKKCKTTRKAAEFLGLPQPTFARKKLKHGL